MNLQRIQNEFAEAKNTFAFVELHPTVGGSVFAKAALQTISSLYVLSIRFPETYPNEMPRVTVDTPAITHSPHRYTQGHICYLHPSMWNPGTHNLTFVIGRAAKWLNKYEIWRVQGTWPGAEIKH